MKKINIILSLNILLLSSFTLMSHIKDNHLQSNLVRKAKSTVSFQTKISPKKECKKNETLQSSSHFFTKTKNMSTIKTAIPMEPISGEVIFSNQPFVGDAPTNTIVKDFMAYGEIYGRAKFSQPLNELIAGKDLAVDDNGNMLIGFELKQNADGQTHYGTTKLITKEELEKNYFDFDIAPSLNNSRDAYIVDFGGGVATTGSSYFENRQKGLFTLTVLFLDGRHDAIEDQNCKGAFTIDYSNMPDGDEGISKMSDWQHQLYWSKDKNQVDQNKQRLAAINSGTISKIVFMNAQNSVATTFKAGEEIYGKINLTKPLKDYFANESVKQIQIDIKCINDNIYGLSVSKTIRLGEINNNYLEFDIFPSLEKAKDFYSDNLSFYRTFFGGDNISNKIIRFEISLATDYNINYNGFKKMEALGEIEIDYTEVTQSQISELYDRGQKIAEEAEKKADKLFAQESGEYAKTLPLPVVFTKKSQTGYSGYSNATIVSMIKQYYKITEVYMLTFDVADGTGDFTSLTDLNNYPSEKIGNHVFYFAFKDNTDGQYKFAGGRLRMLYEGNGNYSEAFIFPYSPLMNGDAAFPYDYTRDNLGYKSVFFMDGAKIVK